VIKIKAVIVEDEYLSLEELKYIIENNSNIEVIETFDNGIDVLNFINKNKDVLTRENEVAHLTSSGFIVNKNRDKVLMI